MCLEKIKKLFSPYWVSQLFKLLALAAIITRMKVIARHAYLYAIAVPVVRIARKRIPWQTARKLTLSVLSVSKDGKVKEYSWQDLKKIQEKFN